MAVGDCTSIRVWDQNGRQLFSCETYDGEVATKLLFRTGSTFAVVTQDHNFLLYKLGRSDTGALELLSDGMQSQRAVLSGLQSLLKCSIIRATIATEIASPECVQYVTSKASKCLILWNNARDACTRVLSLRIIR